MGTRARDEAVSARIARATGARGTSRVVRTFAALSIALLLGACGFHLQGVARLPPVLARTYVDTSDRYTDFHQSLTEALSVSGSRLVGTSTEATAVVEVRRDEAGQRVLSVSARNTPREYEVYYVVEYRVRAGTKELLAPQKISLTRAYAFDETAQLAKQQEQETIRAALARELAGLVMRRLAALPSPPAAAPLSGTAEAAGAPAATSSPPAPVVPPAPTGEAAPKP
jgi:LPS-assembly lipoprotein